MSGLPYGLLLAAIAFAALVLLALVLLSLWRRTKTLMKAVAAAGETVAASTEALEQAQASSPRPTGARTAPPPTDTPRTPARHR